MHGAMTIDDEKRVIRELVENWAVWRDARLWDQFRTVWHADGRMMATWFQGTFEEFIKANQEGWARGVRILHFLGGSAIEVADSRAIAQTKMTISQRAPVDGVICDVVCTGRFYDFFERRAGRWGLVLRRLAYEKDRLDPVDPSAKLTLDQDLLKRFPEGYRHLAYLQTKIGYSVRTDMAGLEGPELDALYAQGVRWLKGEAL
jgi:SnoaL-like domain